MTKRDVAVWFCKVVALVGVLNGAFDLLHGLIQWKVNGTGYFLWSVPSIGFYAFVWLFARGIGAEVAAEGEHGEPITSSAELSILLLRCVGLGLFLSGALIFGSTCLILAVQYFSSQTISTYLSFTWPNLTSQLLRATLGFLLAFGPRLRAALRSN
ncbi:MAG: hypothetical protein KY445_14785 [Armatimonadetes bacterium]|nr:hypothetical protein [Armatimonadota bacterium]